MNPTTSSQKTQWLPLIISLAIPLAIAVTASQFTMPEIPGWYAGINKPSFNPPNWLFAPVWITLYIMMGIAAYLVWVRRDDSLNFMKARSVYVMQLIFNFAWSYVFFYSHSITGGFIVLIVLLMLIGSTIFYFSKFSKTAAWLLVPYILWVTFATVLNYAIITLN